jgi:hypothetical protein
MARLLIPLRGLAARPRRLAVLLAAALAGLLLVVAGSWPAPHESSTDRPLVAPDALPAVQARADLGEAPRSERFDQAYRMQLEQRMQEQMQAFRAELEAREQAREARDSSQLDRVARMMNEAASRAPPAFVMPPTERPAALPEARYVALREPGARPVDLAARSLAGSVPGAMSAAGPGGFAMQARGAGAGPASGAGDGSIGNEADAFVVPQDGWAQGRLLNGIVASQGGDFRYTQIRLTGAYHSANDYVQNVDGCVVLGEGGADVAAGRINVKPIKVTCIFPGGRTRSWPAAGYVVDARDGIQGLAATLVNGGEAKLAAATAAGVVQGAGALFAQRALTSTYTPLTGTASSLITGNPGVAMAGGALEGAGRGLSQEIQNYYAAFRPTVQTGGGVEVTVFLTTALALPDEGRSVSTVRQAR